MGKVRLRVKPSAFSGENREITQEFTTSRSIYKSLDNVWKFRILKKTDYIFILAIIKYNQIFKKRQKFLTRKHIIREHRILKMNRIW